VFTAQSAQLVAAVPAAPEKRQRGRSDHNHFQGKRTRLAQAVAKGRRSVLAIGAAPNGAHLSPSTVEGKNNTRDWRTLQTALPVNAL
jgi:hypothetical protein